MKIAPYPADRLLRLSELERWHFWFVGRRALLDRVLTKHLKEQAPVVLDLGCGTGLLMEILMRRGYRVVGLDLRPEGLRAVRQGLPQSMLLHGEAFSLPLKRNSCRAVILLDVLEHGNDQAALAEVNRVLTPGGLAVIMVPAFPALWSHRDMAAGHLRRYRRRPFLRFLADSQFTVVQTAYYPFLLFPLVMITRLLGRKGPALRDLEERPSGIANSVLTWMARLEVKLGSFIAWPWGSSLMVVCRKRDG